MSQTFRTERYATNEGWAVGTTDSGDWLTCLGSHWETIPLFPTADQAETWFADRWQGNVPTGRPYITRKVQRVGSYLRIQPDTTP